MYKPFLDITKMEVPSVFGKTDLPVLPESVHEQDDGTILAVCATGSICFYV